MEPVRLHGLWASAYCRAVEWALRLKGIRYEYVEEDLANKSNDLLLYNPQYKKVPVIVHNGKPLAESLVILEYIEDTWKEKPLLPKDPYSRAKFRFWANFFHSKVTAVLARTVGEEQQKAVRDLLDAYTVLEETIVKDFSGGTPFLHGESPGFLDLVWASRLCMDDAIGEAIGFEIIAPVKYPGICTWLKAIREHPVLKQTIPEHHKLVEYVLNWRKTKLSAITN